MEKITFAQARKITSPNPFTLICTETPQGITNIAAVSWWTYLSFNPEILGFAMGKASFSGEMVRKNKKVILAMPTDKMAEQAFDTGTVSGRDTDKAKKFDIEMTDITGNPIQVPADSCLVYECTLKDVVEVGDHFLYVCTIDNILGDLAQKAILNWDEENRILKSVN
jgi:flavin reductase (DIM6/NTAB) family NADH-FMN oxidoreductase RutF